MSIKGLRVPLTAALLCLLAPVTQQVFAQAQATTGVIEGRVLDEAGQPVTDVEIEIINTATNYNKTVTSDKNGRFRGLLLPLGPYKTVTQKEGYYISLQDGLQVTVGRNLTLNIKLSKINDAAVADMLAQLDSLAAEEQQEVIESITVSADNYREVVEVGRIEGSTAIDSKAIEGLPNNGRNFLDFTTMTPGVTIVQGPDGEEISVNGQKGINNNVSVDGSDFNNPFFGEQRGGQRPAFTFNLDAVQEVVVVGDGAPAEFGRSGSGFVNVITKSGTNQIHGSAHYYHKNQELNAQAQNPDGSRAPVFNFEQNQVGFTIGGPIIKDKLFYFVSADYQAGESTKQTNPDRIEQRVIDYLDSLGITNDNAPIDRSDDALALSLKLDYTLNDSNLLTLRLSNTSSDQANGTFDVDSWGASANALEESDSRSFSGQLNSVLTGSLINEFRFQWSREDRPRPYNGPDIAGADRPLPDTAFDFANGYRFGMPFFIPVEYHDTRLQINNNLSIIRGSHLIKMGFEYNLTRANQTFIGFANGRWIFNSTDGFLNYAENPNYVECSDGSSSLNGACPEGTSITGPVLLYLQYAGVGGLTPEEAGGLTIETKEPAFFIQDRWDISPTLFMQYGLRWEAQIQPDPITAPADVFYSNFIGTSQGGMAFPSDGTIPSDNKMYQPRFGMNWDPSGEGKSVLRINAGIYYARIPGLVLASSLTTNGSRGQSLFRSSEASPFLGPPPAYPNLIPADEVGDPFRPDVFAFDKDFRNPRTDSFTLSYEREILPQTSAYVKFTYLKGTNQTRFINMNDPLLGSPWSTGLGPDGSNGVNNLTIVESGGESLYRGYTIGINKIWSADFQFQANYTYAKDFSHDDNERDPFTFRYARVTDLDAEWGYSDRDQRHRFNLWGIYQAPWDVNINARFSYRSAQPLSLTETGAIAETPQDRINADGSITPRNTGRKNNQFSSVDVRLSKTLKLDSWEFAGIVEVFNLFNSKNLLTPETTNLIFNFDGTVQSGAGNPRQVQLGIKGKW